MDVIDAFVERYVREYDFYDRAARLVRERLEASLRASGVRCIVTSRAKDVTRLSEKCRQRAPGKKYASVDDIFSDIADLAGVRVALYFPGERDQVDGAITQLFRLIEDRKEFPKSDERSKSKRFSGYSAHHYRVQLKDEELGQSDRRYAHARVEIQVASVLMHAWSEVEHDLVYKPLDGDLSDDEYALLDQLNGMVIAGEIALETLQRAGKRRVAESGNRFSNHYELAAYLLGHVDPLVEQPVDEAGLGRVDVLFAFLRWVKIDTPEKLKPYLEPLHGKLEERPVAEQVSDTIIRDDDSLIEVYWNVRREIVKHEREEGTGKGSIHYQVGLFLEAWSRLEHAVKELPFYSDESRVGPPILQLARQVAVDDSKLHHEISILRKLRNDVVHRSWQSFGLSEARLVGAILRIDMLIEELRRRYSAEG